MFHGARKGSCSRRSPEEAGTDIPRSRCHAFAGDTRGRKVTDPIVMCSGNPGLTRSMPAMKTDEAGGDWNCYFKYLIWLEAALWAGKRPERCFFMADYSYLEGI